MRATAVWFGIYCLWAVVFFTIIWPWAKGRIPNDKRPAYRHSPEWYALRERVAASRGYRCAAGWRCAGPLHLHHITTVSYGHESPWMLCFLCERHHHSSWRFSAHWWADWPINHERWLPVATALVVGHGKLRRLGRRTRPQRTPSPTVKIPGSFAHGDVMLLPDGRIMQRTGKDWQDIS